MKAEKAMARLNGKVAIVTGGAAGIGKGVATRLAADGARVFITDMQGKLGRETAEEGGFTFLDQDVSDEARWPAVITAVEDAAGRLDILVNNAGILGSTNNTPESTQLSDWRRIFAVNLEGVFLGCRAAIPAMRRAGGGSIVNMSSITSRMATSSIAPYGASKAAIQQFTKSVAEYCAQQKLNIRCNSVHPGFVQTAAQLEGNKEIAKTRGLALDAIVAAVKGRVPLGDYGSADDIGAAVAYLVSDDARYVTGTRLYVDGGVSMD